jgi:ferredoxin
LEAFVARRILEHCIICNACSSVCPQEAIIAGGSHSISRIDPEKCTDCGTCTDMFFCPVAAIIEDREAIEREK